MDAVKIESDHSMLQTDQSSIEDETHDSLPEESTMIVEYVEENSMSEQLSSINEMAIDENGSIDEQKFTDDLLEVKDLKAEKKEEVSEEMDTKGETRPSRHRRPEKPVTTNEPTRRSNRRVNQPSKDAFQKPASPSSSTIENSIEKSKSNSSLTSKSIREGDQFQVNVVPIEEWGGPSTSTAGIDEDRDECRWMPDHGLLDSRELDEFCQVLQRHCDADISEALKLLHDSGYDRLKALESIDEYTLSRSATWTKEEIETFYNSFSKPGKNFKRILKEIPGKKMADLIEFYYRVKKARCFTSPNFSFCERLGCTSTDDMPASTRQECENCIKELWKVEGKNEVKNRKRLKLCPACDLYTKISKVHRPCRTPVVPIKEDSNAVKMDSNSCASKMASILCNDHDECFFEPRLDGLREEVEWTPAETLKCVQGFHKLGKDFDQISELFDNKTPEMIEGFYEMNQTRYRLDFLVSLYDREQQGESYVRGPRNPNNYDDDDDDSDNRPVRHTHGHRRDANKSAMITRNKKKAIVNV